MGVRRQIVVTISYIDFNFDSIGDASLFANLAAKHIDDTNRTVELNAKYIQDDEAEPEDAEEEE